MGRLFLARVAGMGREGVIEGGAIDVLGMRRQMVIELGRSSLVW
jgi:hypothetical protein